MFTPRKRNMSLGYFDIACAARRRSATEAGSALSLSRSLLPSEKPGKILSVVSESSLLKEPRSSARQSSSWFLKYDLSLDVP